MLLWALSWPVPQSVNLTAVLFCLYCFPLYVKKKSNILWSQLLAKFPALKDLFNILAFKASAREQYLMRQCLNSSRMSVSESYVGKYTKQKLLGMGTFGEAWLVVSTVSGRWGLLV